MGFHHLKCYLVKWYKMENGVCWFFNELLKAHNLCRNCIEAMGHACTSFFFFFCSVSHYNPIINNSNLPENNTNISSLCCVPVLIITGDTDRIVPAWNAKRLHKAIPGSYLEIIKNCGHLPQEERVEEFIAVVDRFLKKAFGSSTEHLTEQAAWSKCSRIKTHIIWVVVNREKIPSLAIYLALHRPFPVKFNFY